MATVTVHSRLPSPVDLRVWRRFPSDSFAGALSAGPRASAPVTIRPGDNEVDVDFWRQWAEDHKDTDLAAHLEERAKARESDDGDTAPETRA